ncbi:hypothetical protein Nepgr_020197 [Nepenthes gracilis]|uniref:Uncharacterized protein n=1 Tax=Nepenthes gracilis TaxID=150966 RepID=A0AAD3SWW7_NEPGR|nr:hypothetical protein Nepgr_020197 [Nepenthes gracilis]
MSSTLQKVTLLNFHESPFILEGNFVIALNFYNTVVLNSLFSQTKLFFFLTIAESAKFDYNYNVSSKVAESSVYSEDLISMIYGGGIWVISVKIWSNFPQASISSLSCRYYSCWMLHNK